MTMRSAVTVSLVPEAAGGPFVFHGDLPAACAAAARLGFDAVEIFPPDAAGLPLEPTRRLLADHGLALAAVGTGAGWVKHHWTLTDPDADVRRRAFDFAAALVEAAGALGAPAIVGSMQGRFQGDHHDAAEQLGEALRRLSERSAAFGVPLLFEPLNRYETNVCCTLAGAAERFDARNYPNIKFLADLFHMNIEETDLTAALRATDGRLGHVHLADSDRRAAGAGHLDFAPIGAALRDIGYAGFVSAECLPRPDSLSAAAASIAAFRQRFAP